MDCGKLGGGDMKLTYNDGTDLQIQSASIQGDGTLLIKTVADTEENLRGMFTDKS